MALQGLMLLSPAIDVPRTLLLRVMEMLQGLVLPYFPHWRIVPSPPIHVVTEDPKLVRLHPCAPLRHSNMLSCAISTGCAALACLLEGDLRYHLP